MVCQVFHRIASIFTRFFLFKPPITNLGFLDIKKGYSNGTIGILDKNPNDSVQKLYHIETKQEICGYFTCTGCGSIIKNISKSYCDSLRRHRLNCGAPLERKYAERNIISYSSNLNNIFYSRKDKYLAHQLSLIDVGHHVFRNGVWNGGYNRNKHSKEYEQKYLVSCYL